MNRDYITVKEFAELAGIKHQGLYKRLSDPENALHPYMKVIDKKKCIARVALSEVYGISEVKTEVQSDCNQVAQSNSTDTVEFLKAEIERLHKAIEVEKQEKENLRVDMQRTIDSLIARLTDLATQSNVLVAHAQNKLPDPEEQKPRAVDSVTVEAAATEVPADTVPVARDPEPKQQPQPQINKPKSPILPKQKKQKKGFLQKLKGIL